MIDRQHERSVRSFVIRGGRTTLAQQRALAERTLLRERGAAAADDEGANGALVLTVGHIGADSYWTRPCAASANQFRVRALTPTSVVPGRGNARCDMPCSTASEARKQPPAAIAVSQ